MRAYVQALPLVLLSACAASGKKRSDDTTRGLTAASTDRRCRAIEPNGPDLTGTSLSRVMAKGCAPVTGIQLRVVSLAEGVTLSSGQSVSDVSLRDGVLRTGTRPAEDLVGATLVGRTEIDPVVLLRIEQLVPAPMGARSGGTEPVVGYRIAYRWRDQESTAWQPLCDGDKPAVVVPGRWDLRAGVAGGGGKRSSAPSEVTLACPGGAIAKCVTQLGYRPWVSPALDQLHQSCVRAVRADYCGNGESMTQNNEQVNFYDSLGVQRDGADWTLEAQWSPDGARCVGATRLTQAPADPRTKRDAVAVADFLARACPQLPRTCPLPSPTTTDATLWTEVAPPKPAN